MSTSDSFNASITVDGVGVNLHAPSLSALSALLARLGLAGSTSPGVSAAEKAAVLGNAPAPAATPKPTAAPTAAPAASPRTAAEPPAAAPAGVTYDDVKKVVSAIYAIKPQAAVDALAAFKKPDGTPVTKGQELDPKQWVDFVDHARKVLESLK